MTKIIALNGWPKAGKSAVAEILERRYGAVIVDDGEILRRAAPILFRGVLPDDCYTQEGKSRIVTINGKDYTVRQALGFLGQCLEDFFGEDYIPDQTVRRIEEMGEDFRYFVLPSVRKGQGHFYRAHGGTVWQIDRAVPPSENAFDQWDASAVDWIVNNHGDLTRLEQNVEQIMFRLFRDPGYTTLTAPLAA